MSAVAHSSDDDSAIRYVLLVLWRTSCLPIIGEPEVTPVGRVLSDSPGGSTGAKSDASGTALCCAARRRGCMKMMRH